MNLRRAFQVLAGLNALCAAALLFGTVALGVGLFVGVAGLRPPVLLGLGALLLLIAITMLHAAVRHIRHPGRTTARTVAINSAVLLWLLLGSLLRISGPRDHPNLIFVGSALLAYLGYRFVLARAVDRAFADDDAPPA